MRIDSLLNDGPPDSPTTVTDYAASYQSKPSSAGNLEQRPSRPPPSVVSDILFGSNSIIPPLPTMSSRPYSPCQRAINLRREYTTPSRSSYSEPSSTASMAHVNPLQGSVPPQQLNLAPWNVGGAMGCDTAASAFPGRGQQTQPLLPSFDSLVGHRQAAMSPIEGAASPRSTRRHHSPQGGYFPTSYPPQYASVRTLCPQPSGSVYASGQSVGGAGPDALMRFADVAMESATLGGRKNLEEVAAAEVLTGQKGSFALVDEIVRPGRRNASIDIDPALRSGFPSAQMELKDMTSSMATQTIDGSPLFRSSPEPSTPTASPSSGTVIGASLGSPVEDNGGSLHEFLNEEPKCSYCINCTTASPLRKVVSHIFGRNKLSTRQIPKNVWVYYCRKHYQRSRYRNPRGFARQQVLLVRRQCERLERWGGVRQWVIKVRRREEIRMMHREGDNTEDMEDVDDENLESGGFGLDDELEAHEQGSAESSRRSSITATRDRRRSSAGGGSIGASSNWLTRYTGPERTIQDVYRLLDKIEVEVQQNGGKFPDVELLPSVDLELAVSIGLKNKKMHSDDMSDDGNQNNGGSGDSPISKKRGRNSEGSTGSENGGLASKKAKSSDARSARQYKDGPRSYTRHYSMSPASRSPLSGGSLTRSHSGSCEFLGQQSNLEIHSLGQSPTTPPHSPSNISQRSSSASWEQTELTPLSTENALFPRQIRLSGHASFYGKP